MPRKKTPKEEPKPICVTTSRFNEDVNEPYYDEYGADEVKIKSVLDLPDTGKTFVYGMGQHHVMSPTRPFGLIVNAKYKKDASADNI